MNPARKRTLWRLGIVLVAGLALLLWTINNRSRSVVIENHSGQKIDSLRVTVAEETQSFQDVPVGGQMTGTFQAGSGARFSVEGRLADDTRIRFNGKAGDEMHFFIIPGGAMMPRPSKNAPR